MRKTGICFRSLKNMTAKENAALLRSLGFDCVFTGYPSAEKTAKLANIFAEAGLFYESIHAPFEKINDIWSEGEEGDIMLSRLIDCMHSCKKYGTPIMVVHLSSGDNAPCVNDVGHARWDRLVDEAVATGVNIAFENQRKLANIAFVMELYKDIPQVGFCWDCGHEKCFTPNVEYMPLFGDRLMYTHIHDNFGIVNPPSDGPHGNDLHYIPFDGGIDYNRFVDHIHRSGFGGTFTLELRSPENAHYAEKYSYEQFFEKAYDSVRRLVRMCDGE